MANAPEQSPPLLPVIPEYKPWLDRVIKETAADATVADAGFAVRHGALSGPDGIVARVAVSPAASPAEHPRGAIADETA
ncbi:hypothetical protein GTA51_11150 [Desulfovibrio aerotolerans]|uniref:Uncharacterized protein n=1 Tax=Solidesulfovibrio aerotolerans TaxID=295255 RepID=A0A7C9IWR3_9BACT|nr:hypothetical protein [Solidesulfovibrio aerotolerans]MYL83682.1 hypothetical protein [Solidesulfovibrio aerotolerans]